MIKKAISIFYHFYKIFKAHCLFLINKRYNATTVVITIRTVAMFLFFCIGYKRVTVLTCWFAKGTAPRKGNSDLVVWIV
jgi:hypothetical protein